MEKIGNSYSGRRESSTNLIDSPKPKKKKSTRVVLNEQNLYVEEFKDDFPKR